MCKKEQKCIYCNSQDLSVSDIIPYALTGAKLTKKFVCREHNAHTNREFESKVIEKWDYFRNQLGLKTRDGNMVKYKGNIVIDDIEINNINLTDKKAFYSKQIFSANYKGSKYKIGNINKLKQIPGAKPIPINMTNAQIQYKFSLVDLIISQEMKRTISKISYEWHCYNNNIYCYENRYIGIVEYIINGVKSTKGDIVENVVDAYSYSIADELSELGTNSIYEYIDKSGSCYVVFNFWNIVIYKVKIFSDGTPNILQSEIIKMSKYNLDGSKEEASFGVLGNINILSEKPEDAMKRMHSIYKNRLTSLVTNIVLTIFIVNQMIADMVNDLNLLKNSEIDIAHFLNFEEWKRIFAIKLVLKFDEKESSYNFKVSFNQNLKQILDTGEFLRVNEDDKIIMIKSIIEMNDNGVLIERLEKGISEFRKIYEHEVTNYKI